MKNSMEAMKMEATVQAPKPRDPISTGDLIMELE